MSGFLYAVTVVITEPDNEEGVGSTDIYTASVDYQTVKLLTDWVERNDFQRAIPINEMVKTLRREHP